MQAIDRILKTPEDNNKLDHHFYVLPVLNIAGCKSLLTLATPCLVCGYGAQDKIHINW